MNKKIKHQSRLQINLLVAEEIELLSLSAASLTALAEVLMENQGTISIFATTRTTQIKTAF